MVVKALPEIAKAVAEPLNNVDSITIYGEGNNSKMVRDIMPSVNYHPPKGEWLSLNSLPDSVYRNIYYDS